MNLETALFYFTRHSEAIIQWLFFSILLLAGFLISRSIFGKKDLVASTGAAGTGLNESSEIQAFLQKILDQTAKLEAVSLEKISPGNLLEVEAQVHGLKKELAARELELAAAKAGGDKRSPVEAEAITKRVIELESKLAEYEILEDDIADLSLYKEENVRLKSELEKIKAGVASAPAPVAQPLTISPAEDMVAEFAQAVSQESPAPTSEAFETGFNETDDPMADFENAIQSEMQTQNDALRVAPPVTPPASPPVAPKVQAAPAVVTRQPVSPKSAEEGEGDDLFAEFAMTPETSETDESLDTDKMMEEMAALVSEEGVSGSALDDNIDTEKMALEATRLSKS